MSQQILKLVEASSLKKEVTPFEIGDTVDVHTKILEGTKSVSRFSRASLSPEAAVELAKCSSSVESLRVKASSESFSELAANRKDRSEATQRLFAEQSSTSFANEVASRFGSANAESNCHVLRRAYCLSGDGSDAIPKASLQISTGSNTSKALPVFLRISWVVGHSQRNGLPESIARVRSV